MVTPPFETLRPHRPTSRVPAIGRTAGPVRFHSTRAFSLAELLMVMAIVGTAAAIAMPRFAEAESRWRVSGAAKRVIADLERARATALATSSEVIVSFEETSYSMKASSDLTDEAGLGEVSLGNAPYGVEIISADFGGEQSVTFSGAGVATSDGTMVLGRGSYRLSIKFEALGGKAKSGGIYESTRLVVKKVEAVEGATVIKGK